MRRKLLFTVFIIGIFRLGASLPTPGISEKNVHRCTGLAAQSGGSVYQLVNLFSGGALFALLLPVTLGGAFGAAVMCAFACVVAVGTSAGMCTVIDRGARRSFLREKSPGLPAARLLPPGRHHGV